MGKKGDLKTIMSYLIFMAHQKWHNSVIKSLISYVLAVWLIINGSSSKVDASKNEGILNKSEIIITNKYAEWFFSAKDDHLFEV